MVNAHTQTLYAPDGTPVCNVAFDLSHEQLSAAAHACAEMLIERNRGHELEIDDVLALRELTGIRDELDALAAGSGNASLLLPLGRFIALHDAVDEWVVSRRGRDWLRKDDDEALPYAGGMLGPMASLREQAVTVTLGYEAASS
jgi:hypothetical protein